MVNVCHRLPARPSSLRLPHSFDPTRSAGVPGGCGGSERRIRACYNAGCANHRIRATEAVNYKHICASSERRAATDARRVRRPSLSGASSPMQHQLPNNGVSPTAKPGQREVSPTSVRIPRQRPVQHAHHGLEIKALALFARMQVQRVIGLHAGGHLIAQN